MHSVEKSRNTTLDAEKQDVPYTRRRAIDTNMTAHCTSDFMMALSSTKLLLRTSMMTSHVYLYSYWRHKEGHWVKFRVGWNWRQHAVRILVRIVLL